MTITLRPPHIYEAEWAKHWEKHGFFRSSPTDEKPAYVVAMPPPNITGRLHFGHVLNQTIQDILVRRARMQGKEACWVPGIDHASIATEAKVVKKCKEKGLTKADLGREGFLKEAWEWKETYGAVILHQLKKIGISCDWERLCFTLDKDRSAAVIQAFVRLYEEGYIYRAKKMISWDPEGKTALSNAEVHHRETQGMLYYIRYPLVGSDDYLTVATSRPETLLGDVALCVHPADPRYTSFHGKQVMLPLVNRVIPIITDTYVDQEFGTGCLKITPAHDPNDYELAKKHNLPICTIMTDEGKIGKEATHYVGQDRFVARQAIVKDLEASGSLEKKNPYLHPVGYSERTGAVVESRLSTQWFLKMKELAAPALQSVNDGTIRFHPNKFVNTYRAWMENIHDWCISRQLWWGHRIPVYYLPDGRFVVAADREAAWAAAQRLAPEASLTPNDLTQDPDVLDTWFSSWLWPLSIFNGTLAPDNPDFAYYFPTDDLVTAPEIVFFWVARMIMASYAFTGKPPFRNVYFTGLVRDLQGRKMSKSLGNSPDPLDFIATYGADGIRAGLLFSAPAGNDLLFEERLCAQGAQFVHKLHHAHRLIQGWNVTDKAPTPYDKIAIAWGKSYLQSLVNLFTQQIEKFRISEAFVGLYKSVWDRFCAHYLEMVKPRGTQEISAVTYEATCKIFEGFLTLLHPFIPFATEEIWQGLSPRTAGESITITPFPQTDAFDKEIIQEAELAFALLAQIRSYHLPRDKKRPLYIDGAPPRWLTQFAPYLYKVTPIEQWVIGDNPPAEGSFLIGNTLFWLSILSSDPQVTDRVSDQLKQKEQWMAQIEAKLNNEQFIKHAPQSVIAREKKKRADALEQITALRALLDSSSPGK